MCCGNAAPAVITVAALSVGTLLGGSVVIESMFRWLGLGKLAMDAISARIIRCSRALSRLLRWYMCW